MRTKRWIVVVALIAAIAAAGCTSGGGGAKGGVTPSKESGPLTVADVQATLDGELAGAAWRKSVTGVSEKSLLRRSVVVVEFSEQAVLNEGSSALQTALSAAYPGKSGVLECDSPDESSMPNWLRIGELEAVALPASPGTAEEFVAWLTEAFGTGSPKPEPWVGRVKKAEYAATAEGGFTDVLVLTTDLPYDSAGLEDAAIIQQAVFAAKPAWATTLMVKFADGKNVLAGAIDPGLGGFGY